MSDSDSDEFVSLITNGEENFWKTYTASASHLENITEEFPEASNSSTSSGNPTTNRSKGSKRRINSFNSSDDTTATSKGKPSVYMSTEGPSTLLGKSESTSTNRSKRQKNSVGFSNEPKVTSMRKSSFNLSSSFSETEESRPAKSLFQNIMKTLTIPTPSSIPTINEAIINPVESLPAAFGISTGGRGRNKKRITATPKKTTGGRRINIRSSSTCHILNPFESDESVATTSSGVSDSVEVINDISHPRITTSGRRRNVRSSSTRHIPNPFWRIPSESEDSITTTSSSGLSESVEEVETFHDMSKTPPYKYENIDQLNKVVDVKILWKSIYLKIFKVRRFAPLKHIVNYFAKKEQIDSKKICFSVNDKMVNLNMHSCVTLNYKPHEEIEGAIVNCDIEPERFNKKERGVKLKLRIDRKTETIFLEDDILLKHLYAHAALKFGLIAGKFRLEFDGKILNWYETIQDVGLEEDDCVDILLSSWL